MRLRAFKKVCVCPCPLQTAKDASLYPASISSFLGPHGIRSGTLCSSPSRLRVFSLSFSLCLLSASPCSSMSRRFLCSLFVLDLHHHPSPSFPRCFCLVLPDLFDGLRDFALPYIFSDSHASSFQLMLSISYPKSSHLC